MTTPRSTLLSRTVEKSIDIDAPHTTVWQVLTDFDRYSEWNPVVTRVKGEARSGSRLKLTLDVGRKLQVASRVTRCEPDRILRWIGGSPIAMSGEHYFEVERLSENRTRFTQGETFKGPLAPLVWALGSAKINDAYERMNNAMKVQAEGVGAS